jgi:hypothetical protein
MNRRYLVRWRGVIASVLLVAIATGCSKAVEIPRDDIADAKYREPGSYRIRLKGWDEYLVKRFSVTDSTVVIEELLPSDEQFRMGRESLPTAISRDDVVSISRMQTNVAMTAVVLIPMAIIGYFIGWMIIDSDGDGWGN